MVCLKLHLPYNSTKWRYIDIDIHEWYGIWNMKCLFLNVNGTFTYLFGSLATRCSLFSVGLVAGPPCLGVLLYETLGCPTTPNVAFNWLMENMNKIQQIIIDQPVFLINISRKKKTCRHRHLKFSGSS